MIVVDASVLVNALIVGDARGAASRRRLVGEDISAPT